MADKRDFDKSEAALIQHRLKMEEKEPGVRRLGGDMATNVGVMTTAFTLKAVDATAKAAGLKSRIEPSDLAFLAACVARGTQADLATYKRWAVTKSVVRTKTTLYAADVGAWLPGFIKKKLGK